MKPISEQIKPEYVIQAKKLAQFNRLLREVLPPECLPHVEVANIRQRSLMLTTDSPVWTTRLRQLSPQILQFIRQSMPRAGNIHHVQISTRFRPVATEATVSGTGRHRPPRLSARTAELLQQSATGIEHPALKKSLLRLARHAGNGKDTS